eukprot:gene6398-10405_t
MKNEHLLPKNFKPSHYTLYIHTDLEKLNFKGKVSIDLNVLENSSKIILHSLNLKIKEETISVGEIKCEKLEYDLKNQTISLQFPETFQKGKQIKLQLEFGADLNSNMSGFYKSSYKLNNETKWMATTQFEPTDARRAFPCFDEPAFKSTFDIILSVPNDKVAVSNMNETSVENDKEHENYKIVKFATSPIMSTYLVAYIIGEFDFIEEKTKEGTNIRVYTPVGKKEQGRFALSVATKSLSYFNDFFGIPYPLPKMDLLGIPDFAAGAMENWGCVTYRETRLLIDEKNSSQATKQATSRTISHEISHQWFGNLVTMEWWTYLWLNEGFARFIEHLAVDNIFPEWDIWTQFVSNVYSVALNLDSLKNTHAIEIPVKHPDEINEIFDSISYAKGGSSLRMLVDFIGLDSFKKGIQEYLTKYQYSNTVTEDLWESLSQVAKKPVKEVMDTFIKQEGYPVISVKETIDDDLNMTLEFHQQRFFLSGIEKENETLWQIPVTIKTKSGEKFDFIFKERETKFTIKLKSKDDWVKLNDGQSGFYRVNYSKSMLEKISKGILNLEIPARDRISLISDSFNLSRSGMIPITDYLTLLKSYKNENHYSIWEMISSSLGYLLNNLSEKDYFLNFQKFVCDIFEPQMNQLTWDSKKSDSHLDTLTRSIVIGILSSSNHKSTIEEAKKRFQEKEKLSPDLRSLVYDLVVKYGSEKEYQQMLNIYENSELHEEKRRALHSLCKTQYSKLLDKTFELIMSEKVRPQDFITPLASLSSESFSRKICWDFVKKNWEVINKKYEGTGFLIPGVVNATCSRFNTFEMVDDITKFFKDHPTPSAKRNILQCIERVTNNAGFLERENKNLESYFK